MAMDAPLLWVRGFERAAQLKLREQQKQGSLSLPAAGAGYRTHYRGKWHISHADLLDAEHRSIPSNDREGHPLPDRQRPRFIACIEAAQGCLTFRRGHDVLDRFSEDGDGLRISAVAPLQLGHVLLLRLGQSARGLGTLALQLLDEPMLLQQARINDAVCRGLRRRERIQRLGHAHCHRSGSLHRRSRGERSSHDVRHRQRGQPDPQPKPRSNHGRPSWEQCSCST